MIHQNTIIDQTQKEHTDKNKRNNLLLLAYKLALDIDDDIEKKELVDRLWNAESFTQTHDNGIFCCCEALLCSDWRIDKDE